MCTSEVLEQNFFFVMSHLLDLSRPEQTQRQQQQSVRALCVMVGLLRQSDLEKFLPKVLIALEHARVSSSVKVGKLGNYSQMQSRVNVSMLQH